METSSEVTSAAPIALDYDDPLARPVNPDPLIRRARRVRGSRYAAVAVAVLVTGITVVVGRFGAAPGPDPAPGHGAGTPADIEKIITDSGQYGDYAPLAAPVVVDASVPDWETAVWVAADAGICYGPIGVAGTQRGRVEASCQRPFSYGAPGDGTEPVMLPEFRGSEAWWVDDRVLGFGFTHTDVARVELTFRGSTVEGDTRPVVVGGRELFGVYAVWLPLHGASTFGTRDVTGLTGYDAAGQPVG
jgi:hypothetical protein